MFSSRVLVPLSLSSHKDVWTLYFAVKIIFPYIGEGGSTRLSAPVWTDMPCERLACDCIYIGCIILSDAAKYFLK